MPFFAIYPAISGSGGGGSGITSINGDTTAAQIIDGNVTAGLSAASSSGTTTINQHVADTTHSGYLSSTDWNTFNNKQATITTGNLTDAGTDGIVVTGGTGSVIGAGTSIAQHVADAAHNGYLSSADWSAFNAKQAALTIGNLTDVGTDGITVTSGTGAVIGTGTAISQHVADATHNGYLSSADWNTFNAKQAALTIGDITDAGTDGITITGGTGAIIGSGVAMSQHVADSTHNGYLSSSDWTTFNGKLTSPLTTKGDVLVYSSSDTRLPVGSDGQVLTADSSQTTGLKWVTPGTFFANFTQAIPSTGIYAGYLDLASITLAAGNYMVSGVVHIFSNTASATFSTIFGVEAGIQAITGNDSSQFLLGANYLTSVVGAIYPTNQATPITIPPFLVQSNGTDLVFLGFTSLGTQNLSIKATVQGRTGGDVLAAASLSAVQIL